MKKGTRAPQNKKTVMYLGTWFQRTSLHLKELYDFLEGTSTAESLDIEKLAAFRSSLLVESTTFYRRRGFDFVLSKRKDMDVSMTEDGILLVNTPFESMESVSKKLEIFYSKKLGPAMSYLFSRGAPLPKDLTVVKEIYPLYLVGYSLSEKDIEHAFATVSDSPYSTFLKKDDIEVISGRELIVINILGKVVEQEIIEELVRNMVLFRELEKQLGRYLNLHRKLWEEVTLIRESKGVTLEQFPKIRARVLEYLKTLSFVKARIAQMEDILIAREEVLSETPLVRKILEDLDLMSRFQMFKADQAYLLNLWDLTIEYTEGTLTLLDSLLNENTQREIGILQTISFLGVLTGFFGMNIFFPWQTEWATTFKSSIFVVCLIIFVSLLARYFLKKSVYKKKIMMR